jgi:hypothetical protein
MASNISTSMSVAEHLEPEDRIPTITKFRELAARIRSHFRESGSGPTDLSDDALREFSKTAMPEGFVVLRHALDFDAQLKLARKSFDEYAFFPHNNLSALGQQNLSRDAHLKKGRFFNLNPYTAG